MDNNNNQVLGRGLSSLISGRPSTGNNIPSNLQTPYFPKKSSKFSNQIIFVSPDKIRINPHQPRKEFKTNNLNDLAASIQRHGILQPLLVTQILGGGYELVAGERRLRAAQQIGLTAVPVIVRAAKDLEKLELSLIENIQRADLNPIEKAEAYRKMIDEFNLTHEEAAQRLAVSRPTFSNFIRLLSLPVDVQKGLADNKISLSQAKLMLEVKEPEKQAQIYNKTINTGQTVWETKREVDKFKNKNTVSRAVQKNPLFKTTERQLEESLGTRVRLRPRGSQGGVVEIEFYSTEELEALLTKIG
ncbi:MAG TPA: ParB/RepB/Spo0J family partition protein [bacterium]|nr:ParB/RepB/Spo0J family partition protein [bacterium]